MADSVLDAMIDAFMNSAAMQAILKPALEGLAAAMATDDPSDDDAAWANYDRTLATYSQKATEFAGRTRESLSRAGLLNTGVGTGNGTVTNSGNTYDAALLNYLTDGDPSNDQAAMDAYRSKVGGGGGASTYTIGSGGTLTDGSNGGIVGALQGLSQTAQLIAQGGRDIKAGAADILRAAQLGLQNAGQRVVTAYEQARMTFSNG